MVAAESDSSNHLREDELCHSWNKNLIDNVAVRIIGMVEKKKKTRGKLIIAAFSVQITSGEWWWLDLISLVDRGLGGMETFPIKVPLLFSCVGGTENETSAFTHTWQLYILDTICVAMQKF